MTKIAIKIKRGLAGPQGQRLMQKCWMLPAAGIVWILILYSVQTVGLTGRVEKAIDRFTAMEKELSSGKPVKNDALEAMRQKSLFVPASPPPQLPQCLGILGNLALFGSEWRKVGDEVQGAKILSVNATEVKVLWQGKEQAIRPFDVAVAYDQGGSGRQAGPPPPGESRPSPPQVVPNGGPPPMMGGGPGGMGFRNMSPEELAKMRDKFMKMSPEERRAAAEEMRRTRSQ
ncbi:MAG: hypothetical protein C0394_08895 [Syntrophus sp. (in: bacteria)]|nr:hypothetical protein [Syntrophus sp. (in: bacteria)]